MKAILIILVLFAIANLMLRSRNRTRNGRSDSNRKAYSNTSPQKDQVLFGKTPIDNEEEYEWKDYNPLTKEEFKRAFFNEELGDKWSFFEKHLRPEVRIALTHVEEDLIGIGESKIGGNPDLPMNVEWPIHNNGKKLAFLAQLNFNEISSELTNMPDSGILYFFYDEAQEFWGDSKDGSDSFRSLYVKDTSNLIRRSAPEGFIMLNEGSYRSCKLNFTNSYSLPNWEHEYVSEQFTGRDISPYIDISSSGQMITKLFGHSINVQGSMEYKCEMVDRGYSWSNTPENEKSSIQKESSRWRLLFQLDSEDEAHMMWGDVGRLYFWIKEEDLVSHNFDKTWMIFQCH